jgi:hypothetical protein
MAVRCYRVVMGAGIVRLEGSRFDAKWRSAGRFGDSLLRSAAAETLLRMADMPSIGIIKQFRSRFD